jgi:hypothetical protein
MISRPIKQRMTSNDSRQYGVLAPARQSRVLAIKVVIIKNGGSGHHGPAPLHNTEAQSTYNRSIGQKSPSLILTISIAPIDTIL